MPIEMIFLYGVLGSIAVQFQALFEEFKKPRLETVGLLRRFRQTRLYWVVQVAHALLGGSLSLAWAQTHAGTDLITAMAIGGSAHLIIKKFGQFTAKM